MSLLKTVSSSETETIFSEPVLGRFILLVAMSFGFVFVCGPLQTF